MAFAIRGDKIKKQSKAATKVNNENRHRIHIEWAKHRNPQRII
jgi:hypothetical protein